MKSNELELITRAKNGDTQSFGELALEYRKNIWGLAFRLIGDPHQAEDITQDAFIRAYQALPKFTANHDGSLKAWLLTITSRLCIDYMRRHSLYNTWESMSSYPLESITTGQNTDDIIANAEERKILRQALLRLPPNYRMAIALKYLEELDYKEISEIMKIPIGTVGTWIRRGLVQLRTNFHQINLNNQKGEDYCAKKAHR